MASAFSHAVAALGIGTCFYRLGVPKRVWVAGVLCSVVPDLDVIGFWFGVRYGDFWGHRGFTHSLIFAAILSGVAAVLLSVSSRVDIGRYSLFAYLFLATASHGVLDAMTNGGLGVAFLSPFNNNRYFFFWRPILVSPISATRFFSARGFAILRSELIWIWLPTIVLIVLTIAFRRGRTSRAIA